MPKSIFHPRSAHLSFRSAGYSGSLKDIEDWESQSDRLVFDSESSESLVKRNDWPSAQSRRWNHFLWNSMMQNLRCFEFEILPTQRHVAAPSLLSWSYVRINTRKLKDGVSPSSGTFECFLEVVSLQRGNEIFPFIQSKFFPFMPKRVWPHCWEASKFFLYNQARFSANSEEDES